MKKYLSDYEGFKGVDASLETSLYEYGLIWKLQKDEATGKDEYKFIYGVSVEGEEYNLFDYAHIDADVDPVSEWNFVKWEDVAEFCGVSKEELLTQDLPWIVRDLVSYYGREDIFGSSYDPFAIEKEKTLTDKLAEALKRSIEDMQELIANIEYEDGRDFGDWEINLTDYRELLREYEETE